MDDAAAAAPVGDTAALAPRASAPGFTVLDAQGRAVLPGFVDSHTHFIFGGYRAEEFAWRLQGMSYMDIMARGGGIASTVDATRQADLASLVRTGRQRLDAMLAFGVTTVEGKSGYGLDRDTEIRQLEAMAILEKEQADQQTVFAYKKQQSMKSERRLLKEQKEEAERFDSLQIRRQEHEHQLESELEEIRRLREHNELEREDRLTGLWEQEERAQHDAQKRLSELEETRKRQREALEQMLSGGDGFRPMLLEGVTGSGKIEVYLALAEAGALERLEPDRRQALWQVHALAGRDRPEQLLLPLEDRAPAPVLARLSTHETITWDWQRTDHSPRGHLLEPLRADLRVAGLPTAAEVAEAAGHAEVAAELRHAAAGAQGHAVRVDGHVLEARDHPHDRGHVNDHRFHACGFPHYANE